MNGKDRLVEGCLSIPDADVEIERAYQVTVRGLNEDGKHIEITASGLLARVLQHEIDHLKGKLIIDYWSVWKRFAFKANHWRLVKGKSKPEKIKPRERIL
jgi:peptide deformylase